MKNPELYQRTVDILVDAYFNDTLEYTEPCGCAVGNLIAANLGYKINKETVPWSWDKARPEWTSIHINGVMKPYCHTKEGLEQIKHTGYTHKETCKIEYAFKIGVNNGYTDSDRFNGLMEVINCLDKIHENTDTAITHQSKTKFQKQTA